MTDNSSEHTNTQHDDNLDLFNAEFTGDADTPPHRRRNTVLAVIVALLATAGLLAAAFIPIVNASNRRQQEEHATALADCESAQREFGTLNTTYRATLANAGKLAKGDGKTISEEHATALASKIEHIDDTHTVSSLVKSACDTTQSTSDLNELARRFGAASTSMVNRMRNVQTDADTLRRLVEGARNSNRRGELQKQLIIAKTAYERSANKAAENLRAALQTQIANAGALLEPGSTATNPQVNDALGSLTDATNAVIDAMPLDCEFAACVALTFDDGPNKQITPQLLAALKQADAPATFFVQGQFVSGSNTQLLATMAAQGHDIGSLSWRHKQLHTLAADELTKWFNDTDEVIESAGVDKPTLFRPPDGAWNEGVVDAAKRSGQSVILWNVDSRDWDVQASASDIAKTVLDGASSGAIIALHDGNERTVEAIPQIVSGLRERGFTPVTVSTLLDGELEPGTVFYARGDTAQDSAPADGVESTQ
ncbi:polysaccharide deacetylase family protein [Bifidobacterium pseudolongum]|uniref:Polysaccharide deacetylase n=1 Tax=Bifidobacterium pseudolongum subsp. globosum TaxID=1690 RepID=A0A2N3R6J2_9BIFI|nr:polysaccharide deacetylase family protein [Bifidobacterium pseudolongum]PKV04974.1 polysaccharide deacetylase [Bifidobacterium pseudolongum subsp. globosum]